MPSFCRKLSKPVAAFFPRPTGARSTFAQRTAELPTRLDLLERGIAVRQGIGFLRTELPTILATRTDALVPRLRGRDRSLAIPRQSQG
jgi:hypothetical protein